MKPFFDYIIRGMHYWVPVISLTIGLIFLFAGAYFFDPITEPKLYGFVSALGTIFGVGAVFGAVVKSFQFTGVFEQAISDVIYADRFVTLRGDLDQIWLKVFQAVVGEKFGDFSDQVHDTFVKDYFSYDEKQHYYPSIHRKLTVKWKDESRKILEIIGSVDIAVKPFIKGDDITYSVVFRTSLVDGLKFDPTKWKLGKEPLETEKDDGSLKKNVEYSIVKTDVADERGYFESLVTIPLSGKDEYRITRGYEMDVDMSLKPYIRYPNNNYVGHMEVQIECEAEGISVNMESLGTRKAFEPVMGERDPYRKKIHEKYNGVMLPQQGCIIIFTRE